MEWWQHKGFWIKIRREKRWLVTFTCTKLNLLVISKELEILFERSEQNDLLD